MELNRKSRRYLKKDKGRHYPPELMPIVYCTAVLGIVLKENQEAKKLFEEIKDCSRLTSFQELIDDLFDKFEAKVNSGKLVNEIVESAGYNSEKPPSENNQMVLARGLLSGLTKVIDKYSKKYDVLFWRGGNRKRAVRCSGSRSMTTSSQAFLPAKAV